jgi:hypothetical protein
MTDDVRKYEPIFCADDDWQSNACLNWSHNPIELYATGYKEAGDRLVEFVLLNKIDLDLLIYPIVFLYRQYIELRLKEIIIEGRILLDEGNNYPKHHNIWDLWCTANKIAIKVFENENEPPDLNYAEHIVKEFSIVDPDSFSFRYPTTKQGQKTLGGITHINVRRMGMNLQELFKILESLSMGISIYSDWKKDMLSSCI